MNSAGFLFRRLANLLPCVFQGMGNGRLSLRSKYDVASVRDVFFSAHYWRVFEHLEQPPKLVLDLGAHCGHFALLVHLAVLEKYGTDVAEYFLVEPQPNLVRKATQTLSEAGFLKQTKVIRGLVGIRKGNAWIAVPKRNLLGATVGSGTIQNPKNGFYADYIDLNSIVPVEAIIDILKVDIEGSEYDLIQNYPSLFAQARLVLVELHGDKSKQLAFEDHLKTIGLKSISHTIERGSERMLLFGRSNV
jgi:hypothetical protein